MSSGLEKLVDSIIEESRIKADEIRKQGHGECEQTLAKEKTEAVREADQISRQARAEAEAARNRLVSQAKQKARLEYLAAKNQLVRNVLNEVRGDLIRFVQNEHAYRGFLVKVIAQSIETIPSETVRVFLSDKDIRRFDPTSLIREACETVRTNKKVGPGDTAIDTLGGAVLTSEDGRIRADCTFEARLELMEPRLLTEISKTLFGS